MVNIFFFLLLLYIFLTFLSCFRIYSIILFLHFYFFRYSYLNNNLLVYNVKKLNKNLNFKNKRYKKK